MKRALARLPRCASAVTRRTARDKIIGRHTLLWPWGYLAPHNFDGTFGKATLAAIKAFQQANGSLNNGAFTDDLARKEADQAAGQPSRPPGSFSSGRASPACSMSPSPSSTLEPAARHPHQYRVRLRPRRHQGAVDGVSLKGGDAGSALDRIEIPEDASQRIAERLNPGSTLIIAGHQRQLATCPRRRFPGVGQHAPRPKIVGRRAFGRRSLGRRPAGEAEAGECPAGEAQAGGELDAPARRRPPGKRAIAAPQGSAAGWFSPW